MVTKFILSSLVFNKNSTSFALIYLTETVKEVLNQEKYYCGTFVDLQKAFDAVGHNVLLGKLKHFIRGIAYRFAKFPKICQFLMLFHQILQGSSFFR